jgi:hypothetical protein
MVSWANDLQWHRYFAAAGPLRTILMYLAQTNEPRFDPRYNPDLFRCLSCLEW